MRAPINKILLISIVLSVIFSGCGSKSVLLRKNNLQQNQDVYVHLTNGETITGTVEKSDDNDLYIINNYGKATKISLAEVKAVSGPQPVYDTVGKIISEKEIKSQKSNNKTIIYSATGAAIGAGAGFLIGSLASRKGSDEPDDAIKYSVTGAGTATGAYLFGRLGAKRDRQKAIDDIRINRRSDEFEDTHKLDKKLEVLQGERAKQEAELKALQKKLEDQDK